MNSETLDISMRRFKISSDQVILPDLYLVVRVDNRNFTRLIKEACEFEMSFDTQFRDTMTDTVKRLMECGFRIVYGYTQSDGILLLFHPDGRTSDRKARRINSVPAEETSAFFSLKLGMLACFDCRMVPPPNLECMKDYFAWRQEDVYRNSLSAHCYWLLRQEGESAQGTTKEIEGRLVPFESELPFSKNINYNDLPGWQKRETGLYYSSYEEAEYDLIKRQKAVSIWNRVETNMDLDMEDGYTDWVVSLM